MPLHLLLHINELGGRICHIRGDKMNLLTAEEMQMLDSRAIKELGIPGVVLMENAGLQVLEIIYKILGNPKGKKITIFSGKGNNGGDGFVVARHLINAGAEVKTLLFADVPEVTGDAKINLNILQAMGHKVYSVGNPNSVNIVKLALLYTDLVVDAIYGTGFKGEMPEHVGNIIELINESETTVVSVDIPSGLEASTGKVRGVCVKASKTVTFGQAKLGLLIQDGPRYTGELIVADISIPDSLVKGLGVNRFLTTPEVIRNILPFRPDDGHKGTFGKVLVIGGSAGMSGAAVLTGQGALKAGAGLVTIGVPDGLQLFVDAAVTETMTRALPETGDGSIALEALAAASDLMDKADVLAIGPGLSAQQETVDFVRKLVAKLDKPAVVDADALNALAGFTEILRESKAPMVLTPHPGELARLLEMTTEEIQENRIETATLAAKEWDKVVVLKGYRTVIAAPDGTVYINPTGNAGMATGGSGDVLAGIIAGFLAQGMELMEAAVAGVYFHGAAGDLGKGQKGMLALTAGDLLDFLPLATREFC